jgi:hypothetical protein
VDLVACPWLIRKFIDPQAEFLIVPADQVMDVCKREGATGPTRTTRSGISGTVGRWCDPARLTDSSADQPGTIAPVGGSTAPA